MKKPCRPDNCPDCPFGSVTVGAKGPKDAKIVVVGESPGSTEVRFGEPFIGPSGQLLNLMLDKAGITEPLYITNAFQCLPPRSKIGDKASFTNDACRSCQSRLLEEIRAYPRRLILAMGNIALKALTSNFSASITRMRGNLIESELASVGILPMFHPAHVLRNASLTPQLQSDFVKAARLISGKKYPDPKTNYRVLTTIKEVDEFCKVAWHKVYDNDECNIVADIETTGLDRFSDKFRCIGFAFCDDLIQSSGVLAGITNVVNVISGGDGGKLLKHLFKNINRDVKWVWHNGKFDASFMRAKGLPRRDVRVDHDTMLLSYTLDENGGRHSLEQCVVDWLGVPTYKDMLKEYVGTGKGKKNFADVPKDVLYEYLAKDVVYTGLLFNHLKPRVEKKKHLWKAYTQLLVPASNALATIELNGMPIDQKILDQSETELEDSMRPIMARLKELAEARDFNPNSPVQLLSLLKNKYGLKIKDTNKDTLKEYSEHVFVKTLLEYRAKQKLLSTYIRPFRKFGDRVHTSFLIHGTVTGRLSSSNPNMQNIPKEKIVRRHFRAPKGRIFVACDYSQAELRSLAVLSGDTALMEIFRRGEDLHTAVAALVFGEEFTSQPKAMPDGSDNPVYDKIRRKAKTINFGVVYGVTPPTLAERLGISLEEATELVDGWFERFPDAKRYMDECRDAPLTGRPLRTVFGRQRRFHIVTEANKHGLQNEAGNFPHQSMCSDFTLEAAIKIDYQHYDKLPGNGKQINIIHDDNMFEVDDNPKAILALGTLVKDIMENVPVRHNITDVKFEVDISKGYEWSKMEKLKH